MKIEITDPIIDDMLIENIVDAIEALTYSSNYGPTDVVIKMGPVVSAQWIQALEVDEDETVSEVIEDIQDDLEVKILMDITITGIVVEFKA